MEISARIGNLKKGEVTLEPRGSFFGAKRQSSQPAQVKCFKKCSVPEAEVMMDRS